MCGIKLIKSHMVLVDVNNNFSCKYSGEFFNYMFDDVPVQSACLRSESERWEFGNKCIWGKLFYYLVLRWLKFMLTAFLSFCRYVLEEWWHWWDVCDTEGGRSNITGSKPRTASKMPRNSSNDAQDYQHDAKDYQHDGQDYLHDAQDIQAGCQGLLAWWPGLIAWWPGLLTWWLGLLP